MIRAIVASIAFGLLLIVPLFATLYQLNVLKADDKKKSSIFKTCAICCFFIFFFTIVMYDSIQPQFEDFFFEGRVLKKEHLVEPDDGAPFYDEVDYFQYDKVYHINYIGGVTFLMVLLLVGGIALTYYYSSQIDKKYSEDSVVDYSANSMTFFTSVRLVMAIGLLICLLDMPYTYYTILRFVITIGCCYLAFRQHQVSSFGGWSFYVLVAILFNPICAIELSRLTWNAIDIAIAIILLSGAVKNYVDFKRWQ